ncbi:hypothetical protein BJX99DRAFT_236135 [Aspergillus californicus]
MQRIWSRSAPAGPASHCVSCLSTAAEGVASRATSAASKRRLRIGNSVTALYTSIFAAAALADARAKGNRRIEWDEKIAAVKEEVNELVDEEQRLLKALAARRKAATSTHPLPRALQTRSFHTLPRPTYRDFQVPNFKPPCRSAHNVPRRYRQKFDPIAPVANVDFENEMEGNILQELKTDNCAPIEENIEDFDMAIDVEETPQWLRSDMVRAKVIRKLALKQLAIRLILRPAIAHSYMGILKNYESGDTYPQLDMTGLLFELNAVRRRIRRIKTNPETPIEDLASEIRGHRMKDKILEAQKHDKQIRTDTNLYLCNQMPLEEFILRLSNHLLTVQDPDRTYSFMMMIMAFTKTRQNDLAELVVKTILPYKYPLSSSLIVSILNFFRKNKDLKGFDLFLRMLRGQGYPVDMGKLGYYKEAHINGLEITIPPVHSANIVVYASLIKACLRFDQPHRADAYLLAARAAGCLDDFAILGAYLQFYTTRRDWEKGMQVLQRSLAFIAAATTHPYARIERLIALMVNLCDTCAKFEVSEALIRAAMGGGFLPHIPKEQADLAFDYDREYDDRWEKAAEETQQEARRKRLRDPTDLKIGDKCYRFAKAARKHLDPLSIPEEETTAHRLHEQMGVYSQQVLSNMVDGDLAHRQANDDTQGKAAETTNKIPSKPTATSQQDEIGALKNEIAQLKEMVFHLFKEPNAPTLPTSTPASNNLGDLKKRLIHLTPALDETLPPR